MTDEPKDQGAGALLTFGQFIATLEDGSLHSELTEKLREIAADMTNYQIEHGGSPKATLALKFDFKLDKGVYEIDCKVDAKLPKSPRLRTVMWATPSNHFTPFNPRQLRMFDGPRAVGTSESPARSVDPDTASSA